MESNEVAQEQENIAGKVMEGLGEPQEAPSVENSEGESRSESESKDPLYVQKRLKQQKRAHDREVAGLKEQVQSLHQKFESLAGGGIPNHYEPMPAGSVDDEHIKRAVHAALNAREEQERQRQVEQGKAHIDSQRRELGDHLNKMMDKYEDFDDVVMNPHTPFTQNMADAALVLPRTGPGSAGEVLYKLGKNKEELDRITKLHPLDQASEMVKLSHALMGEQRQSAQSQTANPLSSVKNSPVGVPSRDINENTPISALRKMHKSGWK